jgi:hypothetical protein
MSPRQSYVALLHHPMSDRTGAEVTTALTTLDLHDIARTCRTYDIAGFFIVHPIPPQRAIAERILRHWEGDDARHDYRGEALRRVRVRVTLDEVIAELTAELGERPRIYATTARETPGCVPQRTLLAQPGTPLILFGTGFGMTEALLRKADHVLAPIEAPNLPETRRSGYNHLSVRSACAILLDRLYGDRGDSSASR